MPFPLPLRYRRFFAGVSFFSLAGGVAAWMGSESFIAPPRRALEQRHVETLEHPVDFGFEIDSFTVKRPAESGQPPLDLKAALLTPTAHPGRAEKTRRMRQRLEQSEIALPAWGGCRGTVVMLHGRGGIKEDAFPVAERFVAAGFRCLIYDARAHGQSRGRYSTYGARETGDLSAVIDAAEARFGRGALGPLVAFGISQGAAVTLQALPGEPRIRAAVVVAPFAELPAVAHRAAGNLLGIGMPGFFTDSVTALGGWRAGFLPATIRPADAAARIAVPVMVAHGGQDGVIPDTDGRRVYEALPCPHKRWRPVPDGTHGNVLAVGGDDLYQEMIAFFVEALDA